MGIRSSRMPQPAMLPTDQSRRRTERVLLRIPIEISGEDLEGVSFKEKTYTLVINRNGARVALHANVQPGTVVTVKNPQTSLSARFRIVGPTSRSLGEIPEWGAECLELGVDFWGISFPEKGGRAPQPELVDALIQCAVCQSQELAQLTMDQYRAASQAPVRRPCAKCGKVTEWQFASKEAREGTVSPTKPSTGGTPSPSEQGEERRVAKRLTVKLPIRVRLQDGREEVTKTENLSKSGICLASSLNMKPGDRVLVTVGYTPGGKESEIPAEVMWRRELAEAGGALYGIYLQQS